ncbi:MAG: hypothetical protein ACOYMB_03470 [Patescibacteria group bacterium]
MEKNVLRNVSWISFVLFILFFLIFQQGLASAKLPRTISFTEWFYLLTLAIGSLLSVVSGLITLVTGVIYSFSKGLNALSGLILAASMISMFFIKNAPDVEINLFEYFLSFLILVSMITRIIAELMSAKDVMVRLNEQTKDYSEY